MDQQRSRCRRPALALAALLAVAVTVVAVVRRRRLDAATTDFHQRHGPL